MAAWSRSMPSRAMSWKAGRRGCTDYTGRQVLALKMNWHTRVTLLLLAVVMAEAAYIVFLQGLLADERRAVDVLQRTFVSYSGLEGRPPLLVVSNRNYTERSLYRYARGKPNSTCLALATGLDSRFLWSADERLALPVQRHIQEAGVSVLTTQCRLLNQDTAGLKRALHIVLSRYSKPFPGADYSDVPVGPALSMPCRVDKARYEGVACWIVTCSGVPRPPLESCFFSVPVSVDGRILVPRWREQEIP